ncbi:MAG: hypothetical protein WBA12_14585 [Catalinimonas sp.]
MCRRFPTTHMRRAYLLCGVVLLSTCAPKERPELCDCVQKDNEGRWDMHLSDECMLEFVEQFGPELEGLEAWFKENCGGYDVKPREEPPVTAMR